MTMTAPSLTAEPHALPLVPRVRSILVQPRSEWVVIDAEPATTRGLYAGYVAPLAAIGPLASLIGMSVLGVRLPFGGTYRVPFGSAVVSATVHYATALVATYVLALIIDALAPNFGGERSTIQALKVAAYASTAAWIAGVFAVVPGLSVFGIVGLYSLYFVFAGLPTVMHAPRDRALGYATAVIASAIVLFVISGLIASRFVSYPSLSLPVR